MLSIDLAYYEVTRLVFSPRGRLQQTAIQPQGLRLFEIQSVLGLVRYALIRIIFELRGSK
jgi:hypothetical protein